jgi:hypothetical protein
MAAPYEDSRAQRPCVHRSADVRQRGQDIAVFMVCPVSAGGSIEGLERNLVVILGQTTLN